MASSTGGVLGSSLKGKVALITGASSGIGAETARHFASLGCRLALTGRNMEALQQVTNECVKKGLNKDQILMIQANFEFEDDVKKTAERTIQNFNHIDILVNNAATVCVDTIENVTIESFEMSFAVNVRAPLQLIQLLAPYLMKSKGTVVNVSSLASRTTFSPLLTYSMSKTAVDHMTRCIAEELAPHGVRVNAVNPGVILTPILERSGITGGSLSQFLEVNKMRHALQRTGTVDEVSTGIVFLASSDSSFTTGETIGIDGGAHLLVNAIQK